MSQLGQRLLATGAAFWVVAFATANALAVALPDSTWIQLSPLPNQPRTPIFALAVDPSNNQVLIAGDSQGALLRSANGGGAWTVVRQGKAPITAVSFSPFTKGVVLAGTRGGGALLSRDGGASWLSVRGLDGRAVRVFGFALSLIAAGTDRGVYTSTDGASWSATGLAGHNVNALAVQAIHDPARLVAGSDTDVATGGLPLYQSLDGGVTWKPLAPPVGGTIVTRLASGPLPPTGNIRPLLLGTNTGLFASKDNGTTFAPLSGGGLLPTTDYTLVSWITTHYDRYYVGSDGGGSGAGGVWKTTNAGQTFSSMRTPDASVTAMAVSNDEKPIVYIATFQPSTHRAPMWALHDTGGIPQGPATTPSPVASGARGPGHLAQSLLDRLLASPQLPYIGLGAGALMVVLTAVVAHLRGRNR